MFMKYTALSWICVWWGSQEENTEFWWGNPLRSRCICAYLTKIKMELFSWGLYTEMVPLYWAVWNHV